MLLLLLLPAIASAASFDCGKAASAAEKMVCGDAELSNLDDTMARWYEGARSTLGENSACLAADQREWLRGPRARCTERDCLRQAYLARLAELWPLQPGINSRTSLPLPPVPMLMWVMGGLTDRYLAPAVASKPATIEGELAVTDGAGGYVIRDAGGTEHLLLMDMIRGGANETFLQSLTVTQKGVRMRARGRIAPGGKGSAPFFDHRYCIYIYRMPGQGYP